ncbi:MAG: DNA translocase FtsK [Nostocaceae cyanobacterium]|nr:DNA translocase FtsK [Nostocaceae cyanobacterium]
MHYLTTEDEIKLQINSFTLAEKLWLDTEIADWYTPYPKLSLIQVLAESTDFTGEYAYILDVLDKPDLIAYFIQQIMLNPQIEKVFHNASFDLKYLGGKSAENVTCTLKLARKITKQTLQVSDLKLKTLAEELSQFSDVDKSEQASDWGKRPLTEKQLKYAALDTVYLAAVHHHLLEFSQGDVMKQKPSKNSTKKSHNSNFTPTKVRLAFECPRLFYLNHNFGSNSLFIPPEQPFGAVGNTFHKLADDFIQLAITELKFQEFFQLNASQLNLEKVSSGMQELFYQLKFSPYLNQAIAKDVNQGQTLLKVWQGLQGLIKKFAELLIINREYCSAEQLIANTFIQETRKLEHNFQLPDGSTKKVTGEFDCLVFNFQIKRLCVVEFKTYQPVDPSAQLAQVALYSYMLWQNKKVAVDSAVYCVLPEFKEYKYSWEQLEDTVHQLIPYKLQQMQEWVTWKPNQDNPPPSTTQPHLCEICPQQQKCQTYFLNQSQNSSEQPSPTEDEGRQTKPTEVDLGTKDVIIEGKEEEEISVVQPQPDADSIGKELVNTLQSFGIGVDYQGVAIAPSFIRVKLKPQLGVKVSSILRLSADLQVQLSLENPPLISPQAGYVSVDLPREDRQIAKFENYIKSKLLPKNSPIKIALGVDLEGKLIDADLSNPNTCHFLVGGTTGSGKSEFLRSLLLSLLYRYSPEHLQICLVDPKRVTFPEFEQMQWLHSPIIKDEESAIQLMDELVGEMESRYQKFEKARCNDLTSYNQASSKPLPRIVCIFDEYADFMVEKEPRTALEQSIKRLGAKARAAGIHLIIATQRPEAKVVTPLIRSNLPGRIALRTASEADSKIVLGGTETSAAYLLGKGDLIYQVGSQLQRLQSLFTSNIQLPKLSPN